jgi:hypothetical protein
LGSFVRKAAATATSASQCRELRGKYVLSNRNRRIGNNSETKTFILRRVVRRQTMQKSTFTKMTTGFLATVFAIALTTFATLAASEFQGVWTVQDSNGKPFQITLSADGSAKANRGEGMTGTWKEEGGAAVIKWDTGWTTKIIKEGNKYKKTAYDKGKPLEGTPTNSSDAEKGG